MKDYKLEFILIILIATITLFFSLISGRSKKEVAKDILGAVSLLIGVLIILTITGWFFLGGWAKNN